MKQVDRGALLCWYDCSRRDLPWRRTKDPYAIWVSEIMLQQTQVSTVIPYFERWMARFPTVESLAVADEQDVLSLWQGLGYYRRCRLLADGARWVVSHGLPRTAAEWLAVPGVGPYTSGAIASISVDDPAPLVDGNVERVYARFAGDSSVGLLLHRNAWDWARLNLDSERPGDYNQALMELGATVCRPVGAECGRCPLASDCIARAHGLVEVLPTKVAKAKPIRLTHHVWVPYHSGLFGLMQIPPGQWWEGMWEFPRFDRVSELEGLLGSAVVEALGEHRHTVTNHRITIHASLFQTSSQLKELRWVTESELAGLPMPAPQRRVLQLAQTYLLG